MLGGKESPTLCGSLDAQDRGPSTDRCRVDGRTAIHPERRTRKTTHTAPAGDFVNHYSDVMGPALVFTQAGNNVIYLGVHDEGTLAFYPGPYLDLCDLDGETVIGWRVHADGSVEHRVRT